MGCGLRGLGRGPRISGTRCLFCLAPARMGALCFLCSCHELMRSWTLLPSLPHRGLSEELSHLLTGIMSAGGADMQQHLR